MNTKTVNILEAAHRYAKFAALSAGETISKWVSDAVYERVERGPDKQARKLIRKPK